MIIILFPAEFLFAQEEAPPLISSEASDSGEASPSPAEAPKAKTQRQFYLALGPEVNMNTIDGAAFGVGAAFDFRLNKSFGFSFNSALSRNFRRHTTWENYFGARWYFIDLGPKKGSFFLEPGLGLAVIWSSTNTQYDYFPVFYNGSLLTFLYLNPRQNKKIIPAFDAGLTTGFRFPVLGGDYYLEPYLRLGYPYLYGLGFRFGVKI
jgi:hypothetical protein